jgi:hypothetical protein
LEKEEKHWFGPADSPNQDDHSFTLFDGEHLRIHSTGTTDLKSFDLDIAFSPTSNE